MKNILISLIIILPIISNAQEIDYPGDIMPTDSALLFAPNLINTGLFTRDFSMTADGKEIYFSVMAGRSAVIMVSYYKSGEWTEPVIAPFSGSMQFFDFEPHVSPDGNQILFLSTRPKTGQEPKPGWTYQNIFVTNRTENGWSEPYEIGAPINTDNNEFYPSLTNNNKLYYNHSVEFTDVALYCSKKINNEFSYPEKLSFKNDSNLLLFNATISRDDSYILTCGSSKTVRNQTGYYVAFNLGKNEWSELVDLTSYLGYEGGRAASISLSPDGKYIFFSTVAFDAKNGTVYPGMKITQIMNNGYKPQSGSSNIYWISSDFIKNIKKEIIK
jgi:hypothetical protein